MSKNNLNKRERKELNQDSLSSSSSSKLQIEEITDNIKDDNNFKIIKIPKKSQSQKNNDNNNNNNNNSIQQVYQKTEIILKKTSSTNANFTINNLNQAVREEQQRSDIQKSILNNRLQIPKSLSNVSNIDKSIYTEDFLIQKTVDFFEALFNDKETFKMLIKKWFSYFGDANINIQNYWFEFIDKFFFKSISLNITDQAIQYFDCSNSINSQNRLEISLNCISNKLNKFFEENEFLWIAYNLPNVLYKKYDRNQKYSQFSLQQFLFSQQVKIRLLPITTRFFCKLIYEFLDNTTYLTLPSENSIIKEFSETGVNIITDFSFNIEEVQKHLTNPGHRVVFEKSLRCLLRRKILIQIIQAYSSQNRSYLVYSYDNSTRENEYTMNIWNTIEKIEYLLQYSTTNNKTAFFDVFKTIYEYQNTSLHSVYLDCKSKEKNPETKITNFIFKNKISDYREIEENNTDEIDMESTNKKSRLENLVTKKLQEKAVENLFTQKLKEHFAE
jgi:hypothetical protein